MQHFPPHHPPHPSPTSYEIIFLGTGSAQQCPSIRCLVTKTECQSCRSGGHNIRGTSSAVIKMHYIDQSFKTVLIDCGPSFYQRAREILPKHGIRRIDAVLLTHEHGDATFGLPSLKMWLDETGIQREIEIYANKTTCGETCMAFPFLQHPGPGRPAPRNGFRTFLIHNEIPFQLFGALTTPLPVHHGARKGQPMWCLGFLFDRKLAYISDSNAIPDATWSILEKKFPKDKSLPVLVTETLTLQAHNTHFCFPQAVHAARKARAVRTYFTQIAHGMSHEQWIRICQRVGERREPHQTESHHDNYNGDAFKALLDEHLKGTDLMAVHMKTRPEHKGIHPSNTEDIIDLAMQDVERWEGGAREPLWIRPSYDGLCVRIYANGDVRDEYKERELPARNSQTTTTVRQQGAMRPLYPPGGARIPDQHGEPFGSIAKVLHAPVMSHSTRHEIVFLGTGHRGTPAFGCLTHENSSCRGCHSKERADKRRGTSLAMKVTHPTGESQTLVLDLPMDFYQSACQWFSSHGLSKIDAAFVTDSDACMQGIGEMTNWTLGGTKYGALQDSVDVYLSEASLGSFKKRIPYLVDKKIANTISAAALRLNSLSGDQQKFSVFNDKKTQRVEIQPLSLSLPVTNGQHAPALGYLIDGKIAYIKAAGVLSDEARQALQEAKPSIAILGCNVTRAGTFLPSILKLFDEKCRVFLVDIDHDKTHQDVQNMVHHSQTSPLARVRISPAYDGLRVSAE